MLPGDRGGATDFSVRDGRGRKRLISAFCRAASHLPPPILTQVFHDAREPPRRALDAMPVGELLLVEHAFAFPFEDLPSTGIGGDLERPHALRTHEGALEDVSHRHSSTVETRSYSIGPPAAALFTSMLHGPTHPIHGHHEAAAWNIIGQVGLGVGRVWLGCYLGL